MKDTHKDQLMNAKFKVVGRGAMQLAQSIQDIRVPGERLMTALFFLKCVADSQEWGLTDLFGAVDNMEKIAVQHQSPELAGARAYIENDFLKHD